MSEEIKRALAEKLGDGIIAKLGESLLEQLIEKLKGEWSMDIETASWDWKEFKGLLIVRVGTPIQDLRATATLDIDQVASGH